MGHLHTVNNVGWETPRSACLGQPECCFQESNLAAVRKAQPQCNQQLCPIQICASAPCLIAKSPGAKPQGPAVAASACPAASADLNFVGAADCDVVPDGCSCSNDHAQGGSEKPMLPGGNARATQLVAVSWACRLPALSLRA